MLLYSKEVIEATTEWINGKQAAKELLEKHGFGELVQLRDAASRHAKAFQYLLTNKHLILATFVNAIWDDQKAFKILMDKKEFHWAAMANYINGDDKALIFLKKQNLDHYAQLAFAIQAKIRKENDEGTNFFNSGPYKVNKDS